MIRVSTVSKQFGSIQAVDQLSLDIHQGEIFGLLGPNGAGKSTTISMICGILEPDEGSLTVAGDKPSSQAVRRRLGLSPQSLSLYEDLTALDNLQFFGSLYGLKGNELAERIETMLDFVGLSGREKDSVDGFSGGMKRRLNLACSLLHDPEVILLDEPTVGVDPQSRNRLFDSVLALKDEGKTIVYTTHYMEEAERLCDRVGIIDHGRLLALGSVDALIAEHGGDSEIHLTTGNGASTMQTAEPIRELRQLLDSNADISSLALRRPNLERVFLNLTGRQLRD